MGLFNIFSKKTTSQNKLPEKFGLDELAEFCDLLVGNNDLNILKALKLPLSKLSQATKEQIKSNPTDVSNGVVEVYYSSELNHFGIFESIVHKVFKDSTKQFFFYTTTDNTEIILKFANRLSKKFGNGRYNDYHQMNDLNQIESISKEFCSSEKEDCISKWVINNNYTIWLQYRVNPLRQFSFHIDC